MSKQPREFWIIDQVLGDGEMLVKNTYLGSSDKPSDAHFKQWPDSIIHVREVLPDTIQGEKIFELQKERDEAIKHCNEWMDNFVREKNLVKDAAKFCEHLETTISTLTAKAKRLEEALNDIADQKISGSNVYDASELMVEVARAALNQTSED